MAHFSRPGYIFHQPEWLVNFKSKNLTRTSKAINMAYGKSGKSGAGGKGGKGGKGGSGKSKKAPQSRSVRSGLQVLINHHGLSLYYSSQSEGSTDSSNKELLRRIELAQLPLSTQLPFSNTSQLRSLSSPETRQRISK